MEVAALSLLLLLKFLDSGSARVSVTVVPRRSQFFKYEPFSVSCDEDEMRRWTVMKRTEDGEVHQCVFPCSISAAFPATDSGQYWCEAGPEETSNTVNITVSGGSVVLDSPIFPVMEGDDVTLSCLRKLTTPPCDGSTDFYKDDVLIGKSSTDAMSLRSVSRSDEGLYRCSVCGSEESPQSWLTVRGQQTKAPPADHDPPAVPVSVSTLVRHLVVGTPYLLSTVLLGLVYRDRVRARHASKARQTSNDVIMEMA